MNKITTLTWAVRFGIITFLCLFFFASFADAATLPTLIIEPQSHTATTTTYSIILTNTDDSFNLVELEIISPVGTATHINHTESALCQPELLIANTLTTDHWYFACGTTAPFSGLTSTLATFTISHNGTFTTPPQFGSRTALYRHDGLGTKIVPERIVKTTSDI